MKQLLTAALVLASLLVAHTAKAEDASQAAMQPTAASQPQPAAAPESVVISWDRVGGKEKWWV